MTTTPSYKNIVTGVLISASLLSLQGCGKQAVEPAVSVSTTPPPKSNDAVIVTDITEKQETTTTNTTPTKPTSTTTTNTTTATKKTIKQTGLNGTFHLKNTYGTPSGPEPLDATVTLKDNIITNVTAVNVAENPRSKNYQDMFIKGIAGNIGQNIKDVNVTHVNGSSLTAASFNIALHALEQ
jgi:hypothetical protein